MKPGETRRLYFGLFSLGFITILSQLVIIREFLTVFEGNELIIGLVFFFWMIFTAAGSSFAKRFDHKSKYTRIAKILYPVAGVLPVFIVTFLQIFRFWLLPPGTQGGFSTLLLFSSVLLIPGCFISGMLFSLLSLMISEHTDQNLASACYGFESAGSVMAGLFFSLGMAYLLTSYQVLVSVFCLSLMTYLLIFRSKRLIGIIAVLLSVTLMSVVLVDPPDKNIRALNFGGQELIYYKDTPYGSISIASNSGQYNIYGNGTLFFSSNDNQVFEEAVHFAMLQHPEPDKVMIISGGIKGMTSQALKYNSVKEIDYVEINPWLLQAEQNITKNPVKHPVNIIVRDARRFIRKISNRYGLIIVNSPDPLNVQMNRYFTLEFFKESKKALVNRGILEVSLNSTVNYADKEAIDVNHIVYNTLKKVFTNVILIAGQRNYYLASDGALSYSIVALQKKAGIVNDYVNEYYFEDDLLRRKSIIILDQISNENAAVNRDLFPRAYFSQISHWIYRAEGSNALTLLLIAAIFFIILTVILVIKNADHISTLILFAAYAGSSAEFLLVIIFQLLFGHIYVLLGLVVAFYMAGLAAGSLFHLKYEISVLKALYPWLQVLLAALIIVIPVVAAVATRYSIVPDTLIKVLLFALTAGIALVSGLVYNVAGRIHEDHSGATAARFYTVDLAGAAAGSLITSLICFPLMGIRITVLIITALLMAGLMTVALKKA